MGRVKQFDEQEVLVKAMNCFWKNGYENTTVRQLETDMGINQFSIYSSFKSKKELYKRVLNKYTQQLDKNFLTDLKREKADLNDVSVFLEKFALSIKEKKVPNSCLMVSSATRIDTFDEGLQKIIFAFFSSMKKLFRKALENSVRNKLVSNPIDIEMEAEYLVGIAQSISVYSKLKSKVAIKKYIRFAIGKIK